MNVGKLKELLDQFDNDLDVFFKFRPSTGTVGEFYYVYQDTYSFFDKVLPCVLLDAWNEINNDNMRVESET